MSKYKQEFENFLYKSNQAHVTLLNLVPKLSTKTIHLIQNDLCKLQVVNENEDLHVFTDGNCKRNGMSNSKAGYSIFFTNDESSNLYKYNKSGLLVDDHPTNQKAELTAVLQLLNMVSENIDDFKEKHINVYTDSMYTIKCITDWSKLWVQNNWKTTKGENVKNAEIIKDILHKITEVASHTKISFKHVFSHTQEPVDKTSFAHFLWYGNKRVDDAINSILANQPI